MVSDNDEVEAVSPPIETLYEQDFYSLRDECLQNNFLFEDPEFLPREEFLRERSKQYEDIVWLRPQDISRPEEPILVSNKNEGFDIKQVKHLVGGWEEIVKISISRALIPGLCRHSVPSLTAPPYSIMSFRQTKDSQNMKIIAEYFISVSGLAGG